MNAPLAHFRLVFRCCLGVVTLLGAPRAAHAQTPGALDAGFNVTVEGARVSTVAVQGSGKIVFAGDFTRVNGVNRSRIARLNADGALDTGFNASVVGANGGSVDTVSTQGDGKIVIGGRFTQVNGMTHNNIARLNADGTLDEAFNATTNGPGFLNQVIAQADGKIVVIGNLTQVNGISRGGMARLNADGTLDTAFNANVTGDIFTLALQPDGKYLLGGSFTAVNGTARSFLARLNADGSLDTSLSARLNGAVGVVAPQGDGKIILGGDFTQVNGVPRANVARVTRDGASDTIFNTNAAIPPGSVLAAAVQADGKILLGGAFTASGATTRNRVARLNADGTPDTAFNVSADGTVNAVTLQGGDKILLGGVFSQVNGATRTRLARILTGTVTPPPTLIQSVAILSPPPGITAAVGQTVDVYAQAVAPAGALRQLEFFVSDAAAPTGTPDVSLGVNTAARDRRPWTPPRAGNFILKAVATDSNGQTGVASIPIAVIAAPGPQVALLGGLDGRVLATDASVTLVAAGVDAAGSPLASIQFFADGVPLGPPIVPRGGNHSPRPVGRGRDPVRREATLPGSTTTLTAAAQAVAGKLITAVGMSRNGSAAVSAPSMVTTRATGRPPLTSVIVTPVAGASLPAGQAGAASASVSADAPGGGRVQRVELYANSAKVGESTAAPFVFPLPALSAGAYTLTAIATDDLGVSAQSAPVPVTAAAVAAPPAVVTAIPTGDGTVMENTGKSKVVFLREGGDLSANLTVIFKVKGSAVNGVDYKPLLAPFQVVIPAGRPSASIKVKPIDNAAVNGPRTVVVQMKAPADGSYVVGSPKKATVQILDNE